MQFRPTNCENRLLWRNPMTQPPPDQNISNGMSTSATGLTGKALKAKVLRTYQQKSGQNHIKSPNRKADVQDHPFGDQSGLATLVQSDIEVQIAKTIDEINDILRTLVPIAAQPI